MNRILLAILLVLSLALPASGEFFKDIVVTSKDGIWTDSRAFTTITDAINAIGASERDLYIARAEVVVNLTIPANIRLHFLKSGSIANSGTLQINTLNITGDHQIFTGAGAVNFIVGSTVKSSWFSSLPTAITQTSNDSCTLIVTPGIWSISSDTTIPISVRVAPMKGAVFEIANTKQLTINGEFDCGMWQCFDDKNVDHDGVIFGSGSAKEAYPTWWAVNTTPGTTDMTAAINCMLKSGAKRFVIPDGDHKVIDSLNITSANDWELICIGSIVPVTLGSPAKWEVIDTTSPEGVLNISTCDNWTVVPKIIQTDNAKFGNGNIIYVDDCSKWKIINGKIDVRCNADVVGGKAAIRIGEECQDWIISNNYLRAWYGVFAGSGVVIPAPYWLNIKDFTINNNTIEGNESFAVDGGIGISIDCPNAIISNGIITNNIIKSFGNLVSSSIGVSFDWGTNIIVTDNNISTVRQGIHLEDNCSNITMSDNTITEYTNTAIAAVHTAGELMSNIKATNNIIYSSIAVPVSGISFVGLIGAGLSMGTIDISNNLIVNGNATAGTGYGILANYVNNSNICNNEIRGPWVNGMQVLQGDVGLNRVDQNDLLGAFTTYCIRINPSSKALASLLGNRIYNTGTAPEGISMAVNVPVLGNPYLNPSSVAYVHTGSEVAVLTVPLYGNTLPQGGLIEIELYGTCTANANNKQVVLYFGTTPLYDTGAVAANGKQFYMIARVQLRTNTYDRARVYGMYNDTPFADAHVDVSYTTGTDTSISVGVLAVGTNDVYITSMIIKVIN